MIRRFDYISVLSGAGLPYDTVQFCQGIFGL